MKKIMLLLCVLLTSVAVRAADPDLYVDELKIKPGETLTVGVKLKNDLPSKGLQFNVTLPEGLSFVSKDVTVTDRLTGFNVSTSINSSGALKVMAVYAGTTVPVGDGDILTFQVTAAENTALGTVQGTVTGRKIVLLDGSTNKNVTLSEAAAFDVKVYKVFTVTASTADQTMGSVTGGGDYESGTEATLTATPADEGYSFVKWSDDVTDNPRVLTVNADATLTATFKANSYKSTFVLGNGETDIVKTQDYKTAFAAPDAPTWTGYTFKGWTPEVPATVPAEDKTYTAQWQINQYKMTFVLGNGEADIVKTQDYQTTLEKPADPQREGYTFKGWDKEIPASIPAEDMTFTAQWEINQYKMTFKPENGEADVVTTQDYGTELTAPADLQKTGYTFKGWSPEVPATVPAEDKTFTAQWQINQYTMTFVLGNGEADIVKTQDYQTTLEKPADPQREGYTFTGWDAEIPAKIPAEDKTFTAQWQINQYKMTFVLGNGQEDVVKTQDYGTTLEAPANLVKTGYTFTGWTPEVPQAVPAEDKTYTAQWQINQYTMTFKLGNGQDDIVKKQDYDTALDKPADPQREGYTFTGWDAEIPAKIPAEDKTFTAQWQINQYKMTFVLGNGQEDVVKTQDYGTTLEAPANLVKTGYTFTGWSPEVPQAVPAGDQTYTAQWQINQYTMTFKLGNGQDDIVKKQDYDTALDKPADPQREGYTFTGWDAEIPAKIPAEDKTFTAQWQINQYKMTFVLGNGQEDVVKTQDYGTTLEAPANLVKTGYTFTGWTPEVPQAVPAEDKTYTAQWQINQYTVTFKLGNGSDDIVLTQDYATAVTAPADPQREGYTFAGWDADVPTTVPASDVTLTAQWTINQYTVTFKLENGEADVVKTQDYGSELTAPASLQKTGYTFTGWDAEVPATVPAEDKTYTAQWQINQYTVTFKLGNGSDDIVLTQDYATAVTAPAAPQREGYTFAGWDADVPATVPASDVTLTAQWTINQYTVTFKLENGEADVVKTQDYGTELTAPADPVKSGYFFIGWTPAVPATMPAADMTFTAQFARNPHTMTFVLGNGDADIVLTQEEGSALEAPAAPQREGYTFTGWSPEVPATIPAEDKTFTAQWTINQYTVTFKFENGEADVVKTQDYGTELTAPASLQKTGYTFTGWDAEVPATVPAEDKTYTAQWQINQYTVTFKLGNGSDDIVLTQDYATAVTAPAAPQREGYTFAGWDADVPTTVPAEDVTLTAQWTVNQYTVTFKLENGETDVVLTLDYGTAVTPPADPQKESFTFTGWSPALPATMPAADMTFTAQYAKNPYTMTFVLGNGEADIVLTQEVGSALEAPAAPQREGYTFTGWSPEVPATIPAGNTTFTAQWKVNQYAVIYMVNGEEWARDDVDYGSAVSLREYTPAADETFSGWQYADGELPSVMPAHDIVVTAEVVVTDIISVLKTKTAVDVYDLRGRLVRRDVPVAELRKVLRTGVYIIGGRKVAIK